MPTSHMVARSVLENRIRELKDEKRRHEERAAELKTEMDTRLNRAHESDQEIRILQDTLCAMESLV